MTPALIAGVFFSMESSKKNVLPFFSTDAAKLFKRLEHLRILKLIMILKIKTFCDKKSRAYSIRDLI